MNAKLKAARTKLKRYYVLHAMRHTECFDEQWYRQHSPEQIPEGITPAEHYLDGGWRTCDPSAKFSNSQYLYSNPDVQASSYAPLEHYLLFGMREGRYMSVQKMGKYYAHRIRRGVSRVVQQKIQAGSIRKNAGARILVCVQLFYPKAWGELEQYLLMLSPYQCDFIFTHQDEEAFAEVIAKIRARWPQAKILQVPNNGFDIGPFHLSLQGVDLSQYDIVFKLHTKGTNRKELAMYQQYFRRRDWLLYLFEGILGAGNVHRVIDLLMNTPDCGLVAAENLIVGDPRHKRNMLAETLAELEPPVVIPENYRYVAGTCFACRAALLEDFQKRELDFTPSTRGFFSLAHCMERSMCFPMQQNGYRMVGTKVCRLRRKFRQWQGRNHQYPARERLIEDTRFDLNNEFVYRSIETRRIVNYKLVEMRLGDIQRRWFDGQIFALKDCAPYRYLCGDDTAYEEYSRYHLERNLPPMTRERFNELIESLDKHGYDERKVLVVNDQNIIMDGQHRACYLLKKYGEDHTVKVLKVYLKR